MDCDYKLVANLNMDFCLTLSEHQIFPQIYHVAVFFKLVYNINQVSFFSFFKGKLGACKQETAGEIAGVDTASGRG